MDGHGWPEEYLDLRRHPDVDLKLHLLGRGRTQRGQAAHRQPAEAGDGDVRCVPPLGEGELDVLPELERTWLGLGLGLG